MRSGKEILNQDSQSQHSVAKEEDTDKFDCFPTGFEINLSPNNDKNTETMNIDSN